MKIYSLLFLALVLIACQPKKKETQQIVIPSREKEVVLINFEQGKNIFNGKGKCKSCHQTNKNSIGPSVLAIAKIYKEQNGDIIKFLKQESDPIVKPETYAVMKSNFALLKTFSDSELKALEFYMLELTE